MSEHEITSTEIEARHLTLSQATLEEIERVTAEYQYDPRPEPRCYVCCESESRTLVNKLIADGMTNREITAACRQINERRAAENDERIINARSVWQHRKTHFNVEEPAQALYRGILERWQERQGGDFINGVGHAISPMAVLEATMVKGYQDNMVQPTGGVSVRDMISAATKLHEIAQSDAQQKKMAEMIHQMDRIINAAQQFVPPESRAAFLAMVRGEEYREPTQKQIPAADKTKREVRDFAVQAEMDSHDEL